MQAKRAAAEKSAATLHSAVKKTCQWLPGMDALVITGTFSNVLVGPSD